MVFLISIWSSTMARTFNQLYFCALIWSFTVSVPLPPLIRYPARLVPNYVSQLNSPLKCSCSSVTPEKKWSPDKSCSDIAVLIFASIQALLEPTVSFCSATIKITGQWNILPKGRGGEGEGAFGKKKSAMFQGFVFVPWRVVLLYWVTVTETLGHCFVSNKNWHLKWLIAW